MIFLRKKTYFFSSLIESVSQLLSKIVKVETWLYSSDKLFEYVVFNSRCLGRNSKAWLLISEYHFSPSNIYYSNRILTTRSQTWKDAHTETHTHALMHRHTLVWQTPKPQYSLNKSYIINFHHIIYFHCISSIFYSKASKRNEFSQAW